MKTLHKGSSAQIVIIVVLVVALVAALGIVFWQNYLQKEPATFAECKASAGSSIQESYPEVCKTKSGKSFSNPDQKVTEAIPAARGTITGKAGYPSEGVPSDLTVCAEMASDTSKTYCEPVDQSKDQPFRSFAIDVPAGDYYVYAKTSSMKGSKAYYNEYVTCGMNVNCDASKHDKKILVTVKDGQTVSEVQPDDWYM